MNLIGSKPRKIGIWGLTGAGKTTYIAAIYLAALLNSNQGPAQQKSPYHVLLNPTNDAARDLILSYSADITNGVFPPATDPSADPIQYDFSLSVSSGIGGSRTAQLTLIDAAGGHVLDPGDAHGYFRTLQECSGILMMIDPDQREFFEPITRLLFRLQDAATGRQKGRDGRLSVNMAFCMTKIDFGDTVPERLLRETLGKISYLQVNANFASRCTFAISAVGTMKTPKGDTIANLDHQIVNGEMRLMIRDMNQWSPVCLLQPLLWLLDPNTKNCTCAGS